MFVVECGRGYSEALGRYDVLDFRDAHWTWLLALGERHGWTPNGTVFSAASHRPVGVWPAARQK